MDVTPHPQVTAMIVTAVALVIAGVIYADICMNSLTIAAPRDGAALLAFVLVRWIIARQLRPARTADPADDESRD